MVGLQLSLKAEESMRQGLYDFIPLIITRLFLPQLC